MFLFLYIFGGWIVWILVAVFFISFLLILLIIMLVLFFIVIWMFLGVGILIGLL